MSQYWSSTIDGFKILLVDCVDKRNTRSKFAKYGRSVSQPICCSGHGEVIARHGPMLRSTVGRDHTVNCFQGITHIAGYTSKSTACLHKPNCLHTYFSTGCRRVTCILRLVRLEWFVYPRIQVPASNGAHDSRAFRRTDVLVWSVESWLWRKLSRGRCGRESLSCPCRQRSAIAASGAADWYPWLPPSMCFRCVSKHNPAYGCALSTCTRSAYLSICGYCSTQLRRKSIVLDRRSGVAAFPEKISTWYSCFCVKAFVCVECFPLLAS